VPGEVRVPEAGGVLAVEAVDGMHPDAVPGGFERVWVSDAPLEPLVVRSRRPGDRYTPVGLGGRKKLQDLFVDRKVPREARDRVPIVTDAAGRIVWVVGHGIDEAFRVTDPAKAVLLLTFKLVGGST
jgi:tRNA(Ile)-lysidine synthase